MKKLPFGSFFITREEIKVKSKKLLCAALRHNSIQAANTRRGTLAPPYSRFTGGVLIRRGEGTPPYGVLLVVCVGRPALRPPHI